MLINEKFDRRNKMFDEPHIYMMPYKFDDLHKVRGWNGMISPEGEFYKVYEFSASGEVTAHDYFAAFYASVHYKIDLKEEYEQLRIAKEKFRSINLCEKDILINLHGFVNYEFRVKNVEIKAPDPEYKGYRLTNNQMKVISRLNMINRFPDEALGQLFEINSEVGRLR